jgi:16S rRNA processing protein RimM
MGRLVGAFGVHGWVKVKSFAEAPETLGDFPGWMVRTREGWREMALEDFELHSKGPVGKLAGCDDRAAADALRGADVAVERSALGEADDGTYYQVDLIGLQVVQEGGEALGRVERFFETGETSVMVVGGTRERMIPFVPDYVKAVDRQAGRITVDWKPGEDE